MDTVKSIIENKWLNLLLRYVLGFIFVYAAIEKIAQPEEFAKAIINYRMLPLFSINSVAILLPWIELLAGLGLIAGVSIRGNSLLVLSMLAVFSVAVGIALLRGLDISCGCFGTASASKVGWAHLTENIGMLLGILVIYTSSHHNDPGTSSQLPKLHR